MYGSINSTQTIYFNKTIIGTFELSKNKKNNNLATVRVTRHNNLWKCSSPFQSVDLYVEEWARKFMETILNIKYCYTILITSFMLEII